MTIASNDSQYLTSNELFEYRANLAKTDPERLERELREELERIISTADPEHHQGLRQLQWRIDMEKAKAKNPVDAMVRLQNMMWKQYYADDGFVFAVKELVRVCHVVEGLIGELVPQEVKDAEILPLKKD